MTGIRRLGHLLERLRRARRGVISLEFALLAPVMITLLLGTYDVANAIIVTNRLTAAAQQVVEVATATADQAATLNQLTDYQAYQATTVPFAILPTLATQVPANLPSGTNNVAAGFSMTLSSVQFVGAPTGCQTTCTSYKAYTRWSMSNHLGTKVLRPCGQLTSVPNTTSPALTTMPAGAFGATSVLVADISYEYVPAFSGFFIGPFTINRTAYLSPRIGTNTSFASSTSDASVLCTVPS
jgi:Flp pilus assembly protein TadG